MAEKELVESIERLGLRLTITIELAQNIYDEIKKKEGVHGHNVGILTTLRSLISASNSYTEFHTYYLEYLNEKLIKNDE